MEIYQMFGMPNVQELVHVGYRYDYASKKQMEENYQQQVRGLRGDLMVASVTKGQRFAQKFLLEHGFEQMGKSARNPNSGNQILFFVKRL